VNGVARPQNSNNKAGTIIIESSNCRLRNVVLSDLIMRLSFDSVISTN
jgi:hypothetical protein